MRLLFIPDCYQLFAFSLVHRWSISYLHLLSFKSGVNVCLENVRKLFSYISFLEFMAKCNQQTFSEGKRKNFGGCNL